MMGPMTAAAPFRFLFRVRYHECDAQKIVFNARWGDYVDVAVAEYSRALFGSMDPDRIGFDWRLVRQTIEWRAPAQFDDVIESQVETVRIGTTSFTLTARFRRWPDGAALVTSETIYVAVEPHTATKHVLTPEERRRLDAGAPGVLLDHAGALAALPDRPEPGG